MRSSDNNLRICIDNFRAIQHADIKIDGITVLSGVNASGKSTISKVLYYLLYSMQHYDTFVFRYLKSHLRNYLLILDDLLLYSKSSYLYYEDESHLLDLNRQDDMQSIEIRISKTFTLISERFSNGDFLKEHVERYSKVMAKTLGISSNTSFLTILNHFEKRILSVIAESKELLHSRPVSLLIQDSLRSFNESIIEKVSITEYGMNLLSDKSKVVPIPHFVRRQIYIDTPYAIDQNGFVYWNHLNDALMDEAENKKLAMSKRISRIINGEARYERDDNPGYYFKDAFGNDFSLHIAATGMKSLSIMQMLIKNGYMTDDTLFLLDEPEAYLHPQWIVEYANLIVSLHKRYGVKFLIASHSTDMVSAIRYISENKECMDSLSFYLAKTTNKKDGKYIYDCLGWEIEPIFKSFNKSYDRLDYYAKR